MNPRICLTYDDCLRACIASILDRDDVPHVMERVREPHDVLKAWARLREWLKPIGLTATVMGFGADPRPEMQSDNPDALYILMFEDMEGLNHAVICQGDKIIHDPAWCRREIKGPTTSGAWIICMLTKI